MADNNPNNGPGSSPSQRDAERRSRSARVARGIGKGVLATTVGGSAIGGARILRGTPTGSSSQQTNSPDINPQAAVAEAENIIQEDSQKSEDNKIRDIMSGAYPQQPQGITQGAAPPKNPSKTGQAAKTVAKGTGKFYMYTSPGSFVVGKFLGRKKEREEAKKEIAQIEKGPQNNPPKIQKRPNFFTKSSKKIGDIIAKSTGAYWIGKFVKKRFPKKTSELNRSTDTVNSQVISAEHKDKRHYQNWWNKKILEKTAVQRKFIKDNLNRLFKSKAWKYGKYALSMGGAGIYDATKPYRQRKQGEKNENWYMGHYNTSPKGQEKSKLQQVKTPPRVQQFTRQGGSALYRYTTPMGQMQTAWQNWGKPRANSLNNRLGRRFGNVASPRQMGGRAARRIGSQIGKTVLKQAVLTFFKTPPGWITLGVIGAIFLFFASMMLITSVLTGSGGGSQVGGGAPVGNLPPGANTNPIPGFTLTKSVSTTTLPEPAEITYTISFSNNGNLPTDQITIYDQLPPNTTLVTSKTTKDFSLDGNIISWNLSSPQNTTPLTFTVLPTTTDTIISNQAYALAAQAPAGGGQTPTAENCNGVYALDNPIGNFGDPDCFFAENNAQAKSELYELLKQQDPANADGWFLKVIPCESSYNPNAYLGASASGLGAYGLYQMNPDGRGNNQYDSGSVPWRTQTSNAVTYGKMLTENGLSLGAYWHCWQ